jgi:aspartate aminotransferase
MPTPGELEQALARGADDRPRILVVNSPNNPTGLHYRAEDLQQIASVARRAGALVLSDEIYAELHHKGQHASIAKWYPEATILSFGLSKWTGAGGWRLGTFVFPEELRGILDAMARVASETYTSTSSPVQHAAVVAFSGDAEVERYLGHVRRMLSLVGRHTARRLAALGLVCPQPTGAFYVFCDFGPRAPALRALGITTSAQLTERLLEDTGVAVLPGSAFGRPPTELTVRLAYVDFDGQKALSAVAVIPKEQPLDDSFLLRHAPRVLEGLDRITSWLKRLG